ncbi:MAG: hypothetical protein HOC94_06905 [Waddliaceae bacterium]|nr:hypothetical protein [Waddliaceae bacterium]
MEILKEDPITETLLSRHKIHEDIFTKITDNGQQQYDIGFNDDEMMAFYECASRHYDEKNFSKAADVFLLLTTLHNTIQGFWYALGLSEEALEEYPSAVMAYMMAIEYDEDLSPLICCARCMAKMGNTHEAMTVLTLAIEEAQERGNATAFIKEATTFKNSL